MTAGMKNLFGTVPGAVCGWPKNILHFCGIDASILDLNPTTDDRGCGHRHGRDGPIMGKPRDLGFIAMGTDLAAVDATWCRVIGLDPQNLPYLAEAGRFLGNIAADRIDQRGEPLARYATVLDVIDTFKPYCLRELPAR
jgi:uncharacterized protein (DUF362 family)